MLKRFQIRIEDSFPRPAYSSSLSGDTQEGPSYRRSNLCGPTVSEKPVMVISLLRDIYTGKVAHDGPVPEHPKTDAITRPERDILPAVPGQRGRDEERWFGYGIPGTAIPL